MKKMSRSHLGDDLIENNLSKMQGGSDSQTIQDERNRRDLHQDH